MNKLFKHTLVFAFFIASIPFVSAQTGKISGKVQDKNTGEAVISAVVSIPALNLSTATDFEGKYIFQNVKIGTFTLTVSYVNYVKKEIPNVLVEAKETTVINVSLEEKKALKEVTIKGKVKKESANEVLIQQKAAIAVSSGVSAEAIRKTPDRTSADVIKRVSGASIQDGKFAIVRGLGDRYNMGFINGAPLPSSESDRKAFSLDIIPAAVLDNMMITKTATPDMPGDFAGGFIQINTKDIPDENNTSVQLGLGTHSLTTFQNTNRVGGGSTDFLGFDNGSRAIPAGFPGTDASKAISDNAKLADYTKGFNNNFATENVSFTRPNFNLQVNSSRRWKIGQNDFGVVGALTYSNSLRYMPFTIKNVDGANTINELANNAKYDGSTLDYNNYRNTVNLGGILNFSYKIGKNTKLVFKNLITQTGDDQTITRNGSSIKGVNDPIESQVERKFEHYIYQYQQSRMISSQFGGDHFFTGSKIKVNYTLGYNNLDKQMPDFKRLFYQADRNQATDFGATEAQILDNPSSFSVANSGRFTSNLSENSFSANYSVNIPFNFLPKVFARNEVKVGGMNMYRTRDFNARNFVYAFNGNVFDRNVLQSGVNTLFNNIGENGIFQKEMTQKFDSYNANSTLSAGFIMLNQKLSNLRLIYGARVENFNQQVNSFDNSGAPVKVNNTVLDFLPSVNAIYEITSKQNLRLGYAKTVSRPEFREFAPLAFFEVNYNGVVTGNPNLVRATIDNFDLKWEMFPSAGQTFSVNPFYKRFTNPVELIANPALDGALQFTYGNAAAAYNYGVELEARVTLSTFTKNKNGILNRFTVYSNYSYIQSEVNVGSLGGAVTDRPLQGQSPYVFNAGVNYSNPKKFFDITLNANRVGRRIAFVGTQDNFTIWENPRTILDASVSKTFKKKLIAKLTMGDILAQNLVFYQDLNKNGSYDEGKDIATFNYRYGFTTSFSLTYNF